MLRLFSFMFAFVTASFMMAGCVTQPAVQNLATMTPEERTTAMLKAPAVNGMYAANLTSFSQGRFGDDGDRLA